MNLRRIKRTIRQIVTDGIASGKSVKQINSDVEKYLKKARVLNKWKEEKLNDLQNTAKKQAKFMFSSTALPDTRKATSKLLENANNEFAAVGDSLPKGLGKTIKRAIDKGYSASKLESMISQRLNGAEYIARTISNTSLRAFDRRSVIQKALESEISHFRYTGPATERKFCLKHLNKVYSIEQIRQLDNGQINPVEDYGGGFNCHHTHTPEVDLELARNYFTGKGHDVDIDDEIYANVKMSKKELNKFVRDISGAPDNSKLIVMMPSENDEAFEIEVIHPLVKDCYRTVFLDDGKPYLLTNSLLKLERPRPRRFGAFLFGKQVETARKNGMKYIQCNAYRNDENYFNGYYTWLRFGYDAPIPANIRRKMPSQFQSFEMMSDINADAAAREWFKEYGISWDATFMLNDGSTSMQQFNKYMKESGVIK